VTDALRESKWRYVARAEAWHARLRSRTPWLTGVVNACARGFIRAYSSLELPRSVGLAETTLVALDGAWPREGEREVRAKWHGYRLRLDLTDYFQRLAWVVRRWPDVPTQVLLWRALRRGDTLIDGGANIGAMTMMGAWRVGSEGRVHAFEPAPRALERLRWHVKANGLEQVLVHGAGLSDVEATLELSMPRDGNSGAATFATLPERYQELGADSTVARTVRFEEVAGRDLRGELVVKLDIEGFELKALRGMTEALRLFRPLVITEINPEMLAHAGTSADELAGFLMDRGYSPYGYTMRPRRRLSLWRVEPSNLPFEVAWIRPESEMAKRLNRWIV